MPLKGELQLHSVHWAYACRDNNRELTEPLSVPCMTMLETVMSMTKPNNIKWKPVIQVMPLNFGISTNTTR
jgi:hypothetical protein